MICQKCNFQNKETAKFCSNCGKKLNTAESKSPPTIKKSTIVVCVLIASVLFVVCLIGSQFYSNNKNKNKQIFVSNKCDNSTKLKTPNFLEENSGNVIRDAFRNVKTFCVVSDKAFVYETPSNRGKILGYLIKYDEVTTCLGWSNNLKDDFVQIHDGTSFLGWIKVSDIMEQTY